MIADYEYGKLVAEVSSLRLQLQEARRVVEAVRNLDDDTVIPSAKHRTNFMLSAPRKRFNELADALAAFDDLSRESPSVSEPAK